MEKNRNWRRGAARLGAVILMFVTGGWVVFALVAMGIENSGEILWQPLILPPVVLWAGGVVLWSVVFLPVPLWRWAIKGFSKNP